MSASLGCYSISSKKTLDFGNCVVNIITTDVMPIYSLGSNGSGQLGLAHNQDVSTPALLALPPELRQDLVASIRAGGNHTLIRTSSSSIYSTGNNIDGRCVSARLKSTSHVQSIASKASLCAATWEASFFVSQDYASVWSVGTGLKGELGLTASTTLTNSPTLIPHFPPSSTNIVHLAACMGHVVAVLSNGEVWGWGNGQQGQLGEPAEVVWQPRKVHGVNFNAVRAVCGKDFTAVFGEPGEGLVLVVGVRKRDRFGIRSCAPATLPNWQDVQATWGGVYVLKNDHSLFAWGRDDHGQLPPGELPQIDAFAAGSEHVLALTITGEVLAWGWGEHGNCGEPVDERKDVTGRWNKLEVPGVPISVGAGCATSWIITTDG